MRLALLVAAAGLASAQNPAGSIEGVVIDALTRAPVKKASVTTWAMPVVRPSPPAGSPPPTQPAEIQRPRPISAKTSADGAFALHDLPPGNYFLSIFHAHYPQAAGFGGKPVELRAGETAKTTIELTPGANISGRVLDEDGDPLAGCTPQLLAGTRQPVMVMGSQPTDATGAYSLWGIAAGKHKLMMRCSAPVVEPFPLRPVTAPPQPPTLAYPPVFYPGVADSQQAQLIQLLPGVEKTLDFQIKPARVFAVDGILRAGGVDPSRVAVSLYSRTPSDRESPSVMGATVVNGAFRFVQVFPGSYSVTGFVMEDGVARYGGRTDVDVPAAEPVELELKPATDVFGRVDVEGEFKGSLRSITVQLMPELFGPGGPPGTVDEDGGFTIHGVAPGVYRILAGGPAVFVKSVSWGGHDLADSVLDCTASCSGPLRVLLSTNTATIKGTAPANRMIHCSSDEPENPTQFSAMADAQGSFAAGGLRPGRYRVMLVGAGTTDDTAGEEVTVGEGESVTVTLRDPVRP